MACHSVSTPPAVERSARTGVTSAPRPRSDSAAEFDLRLVGRHDHVATILHGEPGELQPDP